MSNRPIHFEITAESVERASAFYQAAFGWGIQDWGGPMPYRFLLTGPEEQPGIHGAVVQRQPDSLDAVLTLHTDALAQTLAKVRAAGGQVIDEGHEIPGTGTLAYVKDTEGNLFGLMQPLPQPAD